MSLTRQQQQQQCSDMGSNHQTVVGQTAPESNQDGLQMYTNTTTTPTQYKNLQQQQQQQPQQTNEEDNYELEAYQTKYICEQYPQQVAPPYHGQYLYTQPTFLYQTQDYQNSTLYEGQQVYVPHVRYIGQSHAFQVPSEFAQVSPQNVLENQQQYGSTMQDQQQHHFPYNRTQMVGTNRLYSNTSIEQESNINFTAPEQDQFYYQDQMNSNAIYEQQLLKEDPSTLHPSPEVCSTLNVTPTYSSHDGGCNSLSDLLEHEINFIEPNNIVHSNVVCPKLEQNDMDKIVENSTNAQTTRVNHKRSLPRTAFIDHQHQVDNEQECRREQQSGLIDMKSSANISQDWLDNICRHLIEHMDQYGICVIDNFLGSIKGDMILEEVKQLYSSGQHTRGRLVSTKLGSRHLSEEIGAIRNDRVIWIDGFENGCHEINDLIQTLCSVITNSSRLSLYSNNGLDKIVINKRTKAHVACYPGNGTRYIKHVDNPNNDGRVITSIYYLNKDWNIERDGGLLRMFPVGMDEVANIEPLFDRVLFFWSDRRNPHEVLPAYRDRFAITVWYIAENRT